MRLQNEGEGEQKDGEVGVGEEATGKWERL
jgi:hypothetical protein